MGWGSKTTTTTNQQQSQQSSNTSTPIEDSYFSDFRKGLVSQFGPLLAKAQAPVYGQAQQAEVLSNLNELANASSRKLLGQLSQRGQGASGAGATGLAGIEGERLRGLSDFFSQLPGRERQAQLSNIAQVLGLGANFAGRAPVGEQQTGTGSSSMSGTQVQQTNPGLSGLVGSLIGLAGAGLTGGLSGMLGGIGFGKGFGGGLTGGLYNPWAPTQGAAYKPGQPGIDY